MRDLFHTFAETKVGGLFIYTTSFFFHSFANGHLASLHALAIVSSASMKIGVHESFQIMVLSRYMPRSGIAGSYGNSIFSFLRKKLILSD